ncbi:uncharacterized protein LOC127278085 isoform X2 [Leptopilina boulardi]|uniref:uncharacterized protein LOC127278085 isoform X2 n=1 Tax=Leptopilina boulardi TaxID=63433 RepID=UPI0021F516D1|nr:uncharacterized protein LOC127278085 isoform X2 [Leptopilina boulardi]
MVLVCVYCGKKDAKGVSFHIFPIRPELRQIWIKNMNLDENFELTSNSSYFRYLLPQLIFLKKIFRQML